MEELGSNAPKGQDNTPTHGNDLQDSGALGSLAIPEPNSPISPSKGNGSHHEPQRVPWWKRFPLQLLVEIAVFIVGIRVACIYSKQLDQMIASNDLNGKALYSVQRAFIISNKPTTGVVRYGMINGVRRMNPSRTMEFTAHWENVGNTPAVGVITAVGKAEQTDEITEEEFISTPFDRTSARSAIGPKAIIDSRTLVDDDTLLTDNPGLPRFYWGWTVYRDTFAGSKTHVTEWCWKITAIVWKLSDNGRLAKRPESSGSACVHHNCVDEFCEDYANITTLSPPN
jgi:hypothetical protein